MFNQDLLNDCDNLDSWSSKCGAVSNGGYGPRATELGAILPENLAPAMYWTDYYMGEIIYHNRMMNYKCRTLDPESAATFYIPFYAAITVGKYLWGNHTAKERDRHCEMLLRWLQEQPHWKKTNGSNHIIMLGRLTWAFRRQSDSDADWGSSFLRMPAMKNVVRLSAERSPWDSLEVAVPYPTFFHPSSHADIPLWQAFVASRRRSSLFCFVGATRAAIKNDFRGLLMGHCVSESGSCLVVDCSKTRCVQGSSAIVETFLGSDFCLQPKGDGFTRRSVFDCMLAGSIPVFFWKQTAYEQYEPGWFLPGEPESYSVFIDHRDVRNGISVRRVLEKYSKEEVARMRERVIEYIPKFVYGKPKDGLESWSDAFDIAIEGVMRKFKGSHENKRENGKCQGNA